MFEPLNSHEKIGEFKYILFTSNIYFDLLLFILLFSWFLRFFLNLIYFNIQLIFFLNKWFQGNVDQYVKKLRQKLGNGYKIFKRWICILLLYSSSNSSSGSNTPPPPPKKKKKWVGLKLVAHLMVVTPSCIASI